MSADPKEPGGHPSADRGRGEDPPAKGPQSPPSPAGEDEGRGLAAEAEGDQAGGPGGAEEVEADLDRLLADTQRERDEYLELARRTKADFENYRRRMAVESEAAALRGKAALAADLIPALDNLERALEAVGIDCEGADPSAGEGAGTEGLDGLAHGVLLVFCGLRETLARNGIEALDPRGEKFDPRWHEALSTAVAEEAEPGTVLEVMQKGYRLEGQLIRPARVLVSE